MADKENLRWLSIVFALVVIALGSAALVGWGVGFSRLTGVVSSWPRMQPVTAVCLMLCGGAVLLRHRSPRPAGLCGAAAAAAAAWTLAAHGGDLPLPLDRLLFPGSVMAQTNYKIPGRMEVGTAVSVLLVAIAAVGAHSPRSRPWASRLATTALALPSMALAGYLFGLDLQRGIGILTNMSVLTAFALTLLALAVLALMPQNGWLARFQGRGPGARLARTLLPVAIVGPLIASWLLKFGVQAGLYSADFQLAFVVLVTAGLIGTAILLQAGRLDRSEAQRRESQERLVLFIEEAPAAIAMFDHDLRYLTASRRYIQDYRLPPDEDLTGRPLHEVCPGLPRGWHEFRTRVLDGDTVEALEEPLQHADGTMDWIDWRLKPWHDSEGTVGGVLVFSEVVTTRRRAREALQASEDQLRRVVEGAPFPIMVHAEGGDVIHISQAWLDITGYGADEVATTAQWASRAHRTSDGATPMKRSCGLDRPLDEGEHEILAADGRTLLWSFRSAPIGVDARGQALVVTMAADLTSRRDAERRLHLVMRELDHRAKNVLAVVQAVVQLSRATDPKEFVAAVEGRIAAMARAHSLLAAAGWAGVDLHRLVTDELAPWKGTGRVGIGGPPAQIRSEAAQAMVLALHELATNAAKYGALSTAAGCLSVSWQYHKAQGQLRLDWSETVGSAIGGPPARRGFGSELLEGTIVGQLGGDLKRDWRPDGLSCCIVLPADCWEPLAVAGPTMAAPDGTPAPVPVGEAPASILVVEDEPLTAMLLRRELEAAGYAVVGPAARVAEALSLIAQRRPDAAVLDARLFDAFVTPVATALNAMGVPFVLCSGYGSLAGLPPALEGMPLLKKPVDSLSLQMAVAELLARPARAVGPS